MPDDQNINSQNNSEIDLVYLFIKTGEFIKKTSFALIKLIGSILVFLLQKWYFFAIALVITLLSSVIINRMSEPFYHSFLTLRSNATNNQSIMFILERLGEYAKVKNYEALSEELNLSLEDAIGIKGIETYWYYDLGKDGIFDGLDMERRYLSDTSILKIDSVFSVRAEVYQSDILENLEKGLIYFIDKNQFLESLNKQRLADLKSQLMQIEYEIEKLDSLQKREYFTNPDELRQKEGQIVFTSEKVVQMYHSQMFHLLRLKQECERDLNIYSKIATVFESFSVPTEPDNGTIKTAKKLIWYFLGFALVFSVLLTYRKRIWKL